MSLKIIKADNSVFNEFLQKVNSETGVSFNYADYKYDTITFPDGKTVKSDKTIASSSSVKDTMLVDTDNHFLLYTNTIGAGSEYLPDNTYNGYGLPCVFFVAEYNDGIIWINMNDSLVYEIFNIPRSPQNEPRNNSINLTPCVYGFNNNSYQLKNVFVNYTRRFDNLLKFIDQNGNEFITLGGYLLYYNGKHK